MDSDICSYLIKGSKPWLTKKVKSHRPSILSISEITECGMLVGLERTANPQQNALALRGFLSSFSRMSTDFEDIKAYVRLYQTLRKRGTPIGCVDTFLAAQCLRREYVLVTNNFADFERVPGLKLENWSIP